MTTATLLAATRSGLVEPRWSFPKVASIVGAVILAAIWLVPLLWARHLAQAGAGDHPVPDHLVARGTDHGRLPGV